MLVFAISLLGLVALAGIALVAILLMPVSTRRRIHWPGVLHGAGGAAGSALLVVALRGAPPTAHAIKMGVGVFGKVSAALIGIALGLGAVILVFRLLRGKIPMGVVAAHGLAAIIGYTLLIGYVTML